MMLNLTILPLFTPTLAAKIDASNKKIQYFFSFLDSYFPNLRIKTQVVELYHKKKFSVPGEAIDYGPNPFLKGCKKK